MELTGDINKETGIIPCFSIGHNHADYFITGTDGLSYARRMGHGFPSIIIRGYGGGGFMGSTDGGEEVHQSLSTLTSENYTNSPCGTVAEILNLMPQEVVIRDEHGCQENLVRFLNRQESGGIGTILYRPFYDERDFWEHRNEGTPIDEDHIQEAHFLIVPKDSLDYKNETTESIVYATIEQMQAILNLSLAIKKIRKSR